MSTKPPIIRTVAIHSLNDKGHGEGETDTGGALTVPFTAPGDVVEASKAKRRQGRLERVVTPSPERIEPRCRHFQQCGGCSWQHLGYKNQLQYKKDAVARWFARHGVKFDLSEVEILPSPPFAYRNRMDFVWSYDGRFGLREQGRFYRIVDLNECHLIPAELMERALEVNRRAHELELPFRDDKRKKRGLRYLIVRRGVFTGEVMFLFVSDDMPLPPSLWEGLGADSVYQLINDNLENDRSDGEPRHLDGALTFHDEAQGRRFAIGPRSFYQPNPIVAEAMAGHVQTLLDERGGESLLDLFCGIGYFTSLLADRFERIIGIELVEEALRYARRNAPQANVDFVCMNAEAISGLNARGIDTLLIDPPRSGLHPKTLKWILAQPFRQIIYVSCNPKRGAEDIAALSQAYSLDHARLFDQFPQTPHVEMIARLIRNNP